MKEVVDREHYHYNTIMILRRFSLENFLKAIEAGIILVDFDARTGHNHGTKFRMRQGNWDRLYSDVKTI